jgi:Holliday junction resolvase
MADTPERKVKKKVITLLKERGAYYAMPVASGFGNAGVPDILVCYGGWFIGVECKAKGGKPTALQLSNLKQIKEAGGVALIIDEWALEERVLDVVLDSIDMETKHRENKVIENGS